MTTLLVYVGIALGASFICSVLEAVLLSCSRSHVELLVREGRRSGIIVQHLKRDIDRAISAILTLNTIAHTLGAAGAGAQAATIFGDAWIGLFSAILTLLILIVSEIIPKTLGAVYWRQLLPISAYSIRALIWILYPVVWLCQGLTRVLKPKEKRAAISRAELEVLAALGGQEGAIEAEELRVIRNLLHLGQVTVDDIRTPRTVTFTLPEDETVSAALERVQLAYSRIPLQRGGPDQIEDFVLRVDILAAAADGRGETTLRELSRPLSAIPGSASVATALERFVSEREHIFLVTDEYGGTDGIVTLEDAIETLLGAEITDETDLVADLQELARRRSERYHAVAERSTRH